MFGDPFKIEENGEINQELFNTIEEGYVIIKNYTSRIYGFIIGIINNEINDFNTFHEKLVKIKFYYFIFLENKIKQTEERNSISFVKNKRQKT